MLKIFKRVAGMVAFIFAEVGGLLSILYPFITYAEDHKWGIIPMFSVAFLLLAIWLTQLLTIIVWITEGPTNFHD